MDTKDPSYLEFLDFSEVKLHFGFPADKLNFGYTALPNFKCDPDPLFEDSYFILYRRSEYAAQVELACSKIFKKLMGYGLDMKIVEKDGEFYIASRKIKGFVEGCPDCNSSDTQNVVGLAAIFVISYFICETDMQSSNYGFQTSVEGKKVFKIDMAEALDFNMFNQPLELAALQKLPYIVEKDYYGVSQNVLPLHYVCSENFQNEKIGMLKLIASTPFDVFQRIIQETITSDLYSHMNIMHKKCLKFLETQEEIDQMQSEFSQIEPDNYSKESLISLLRARHQEWQKIVLENTIEQDATLADDLLFMQEMNKFHGGDSSSDEYFSEEPGEFSYANVFQLSVDLPATFDNLNVNRQECIEKASEYPQNFV